MNKKRFPQYFRNQALGAFLKFSLLLVSAALPSMQPVLAQCLGIPDSECTALYAIYDSTGGRGWSYNDGWKSTTIPTGTWEGVTVENSHVVKLDLSYNRLSGKYPGK